MKRLALSFVAFLALSMPVAAQTTDLQAAVGLFQKVRTVPNQVYVHANGWEGKLDVYALRSPTPTPTVIFIHGGGWVQGTKEASVLTALPYIAMGYSVVNVEYRLANVSLAPAAIEDCRCALRWVVAHAKDYNLDTDRLVIATNAWAAGLPELGRRLVAITSDMVMTAPVPDRIRGLGWVGGECITDSQMMVDYYHVTREGRLAFGKGGWGIAFGGAIGADRHEQVHKEALSLEQAAAIARAWSLVHGFTMLLLDNRLSDILCRLPKGTDAETLLNAMLKLAIGRPPGA